MSPLNVVQEPAQREDPLSSVKAIIAVGAGKGGVGKSMVAVHLALALKDRGRQVGLLDADVYGPSLEKMLPVGLEPAEHPEHVERLLPAMTCGMPFISVAHFWKEASNVRAPIANRIIDRFLSLVDWGHLDYLIVDFPPGTGDIPLTLMQRAPIAGALMVTTPQAVAALDVRKAMQLFRQLYIPLLGIVENMSYFEAGGKWVQPFGSGGGGLLSEEFGVPLLSQIPIDPMLSRVGDLGQCLFRVTEAAAAQNIFSALADRVEQVLSEVVSDTLAIRQGSAHHLEFFLNGAWRPLSLAEIQKHCPCARCQGEVVVQKGVGLLEFSRVGRYAIEIRFSSGCSRGIYPFSLITDLLQK